MPPDLQVQDVNAMVAWSDASPIIGRKIREPDISHPHPTPMLKDHPGPVAPGGLEKSEPQYSRK